MGKLQNNTKTIFMTSYTDMKYLKKAYELDCEDYIKKPFELRELELRIKKLLFKKTNYIEVNDDYKFDLKKLKLFYKNKEVELTNNEKYFLELLFYHLSLWLSLLNYTLLQNIPMMDEKP